MILLLFIMRVDVLINDRQLLLRGSGDFVSEYGLLKCNEWKIGVVDWGEKAVVFVESGFVTMPLVSPFEEGSLSCRTSTNTLARA